MTAVLKVIHNSHELSGKRDYINYATLTEPKTGVLFIDFISQTVARKAKRMGNSYKQAYKSLIRHLNNFSDFYDVNIFTNSVNEDFLDDFIVYLQEINLKQGYIKNLLALVKAMIKKAGTYGYAVDPSYDDVELEDDIPFSVYLSMNEITRIYYFQGLTRFQ